MIEIRKMQDGEVPQLFGMAVRAFQPDYERYGAYPPLLRMKERRFLPPLRSGLTVLAEGEVVGGVFAMVNGSEGELGAIFMAPEQQQKGYGRETMLAVERAYPQVTRWRLDTPGRNFHLHRFYESLGYVKVGEQKDPGSEMVCFLYEKEMGR